MPAVCVELPEMLSVSVTAPDPANCTDTTVAHTRACVGTFGTPFCPADEIASESRRT